MTTQYPNLSLPTRYIPTSFKPTVIAKSLVLVLALAPALGGCHLMPRVWPARITAVK
jgi:hypothetical protein